MSNLSGLPPAALALAAAKAQIQDIAVRLINLPESLQNNPQSLHLSGTVKGQTPEGLVQVETERGIINILLKDRGNLPVGQKIDIDIPAGRPPSQAAIRPQAQTPAPVQTPHIQIPAGGNLNPVTPAVTNAGVKLDRPHAVKPDDLAEALSSVIPGEDIRLSAPLQAGQILRLIPISSMPQELGSLPSLANFSPEELFSSLIKMIDQATDLPIETKRNLTQILGRIDITSLLPASDEETITSRQAIIETAFQKLAQTLDLPQNLKLQNASLPNTPVTIFPNPGRPIDVQILAFQNGNFQAALTQAQTPATGTPLSISGNFIALPQAPLPPQNLAMPMATPLPQPVSDEAPSPQPPTQIPAQAPSSPQPQMTAAAPAIPQSPQQPPPAILGQVVSFTAQGQPIVSLALPGSPRPVNYAVQFVANNIIEGAPIIVSPLATKPALQAGIVPFAIGANQPLASWVQPEIWDSLQTLITTITHLNPAMAQAMTQMLPSAAQQPQNMGVLSLFFLAIMRSGDIESWTGEPAIDLLKINNKLDILRAVAGESAMTQRLETTPLPNDWKATILPFWNHGQIEKLPFYYKNWNEDDGHENDMIRKKTRFMFELNLSRMGKVQVDGFMKQEKLDMILRTKAPVSNPMQEALRKLYHTAMERSNLSGEMTFQFKPEQWVNVGMPQENA